MAKKNTSNKEKNYGHFLLGFLSFQDFVQRIQGSLKISFKNFAALKSRPPSLVAIATPIYA